ncbi:carbonic anhydrase [Mycena olivaceomarginata]|nr:carbonic anhydrase [Mycena olivaceomarginata]
MGTEEFNQANEKYAASFEKPDRSKLFRNMIVVCCMDPRVNPYDQLGVRTGETITIRNARGSAKEALRSILWRRHFIGVFHHTDCGMSRTTTDQVRALVKKANAGRDDIAETVDGIDFLHITGSRSQSGADVKFLAENPLVLRGTKISGWIYDVETGKISKVVEADHEA